MITTDKPGLVSRTIDGQHYELPPAVLADLLEERGEATASELATLRGMRLVSLPWTDVEIGPEAGRGVLVDDWGSHFPSYLEDCELPGLAPFRLPSQRYADVSYACRVEITGRKGVRRPYDDRLWVRVKVTFIGNGEPDTVVRGWMTV